MSIRIALTDDEINSCYAVMRELRSHIGEEEFLPRVRSQESAGYRLAYLEERGRVVAVAGFRVGENLAWGRFLYVDDLITLPEKRSKGHGAKLLSWLKERASMEDCKQLHLDSGIHRKDAHRFYEREGMAATGFHFAQDVLADKTS